jgi:hypothetical protein
VKRPLDAGVPFNIAKPQFVHEATGPSVVRPGSRESAKTDLPMKIFPAA